MNITSSIFSVASLNAPNITRNSIINEGKVIHVWDARLILTLSHVFGLPYKVYIPQNNVFGEMLSEGNWSGTIGMVIRSEVDLSIPSPVHEHIRQAVNLSYPYLFSKVSFMTDKPQPLSTNFALLYPFLLELWVTILKTIIFVSLLLFLILKQNKSFYTIIFSLFGSLFEESVNFKFRKLSTRLFWGAWFIFIFVIINSYKALVLSFITFPPLTGIRTIADLAEAADRHLVTCYTEQGTMLEQYLKKSEFKTWRSVGECIERNPITGTQRDLFRKAAPPKAFIGTKIFLMYYEREYFVSDDSFYNIMYALPISKTFCCEEKLIKNIHRMLAAGLFSKMYDDETFQLLLRMSPVDDSKDADAVKTIRLQDFKGIFLMLFAGYFAAIIVFFGELAMKAYSSRQNN